MIKKTYCKLLSVLVFLLLCFSNLLAAEVPQLYCKSAILLDNDSGKTLYGINENEKVYPASTTKILTAILALENLDFSSSTVVTKEAVNLPYGSSNAALREGEVMSIEDLAYAMMLKSGNDAANVLAEAVSGNIEDFVSLMNAKAKELGCENTHFTNAHGYHDDNHYSTPIDMMRILSYAIQNEEFVKIFSTRSYTIKPTNKTKNERVYQNTNRLILTEDESYLSRYYEHCVGGKTGYTDEAGRTLVAYAKSGNKNLLLGVFNSNPSGIEDLRYTDSINLFEYGFNNFEKKIVLNKEDYSFTYKNKENDMIYNYSIYDNVSALTSSEDLNKLTAVDYTINLDYDTLNKYDINTENYEKQVVGTITVSFSQNSSTYDKEYNLVLTNIEQFPWLERSSTHTLLITIAIILFILIVAFFFLKISIRIWTKKVQRKQIPSRYVKGNIKYKSRRKR